MQPTPHINVWDVVTDFLANSPTPEEIIAFHFPPDVEARLQILVEHNRDDQLSYAESKELAEFLSADHMMALLKGKLKLRQRNNQSSG